MPGIYVRTLSQFDLLNQEKESSLIIPGSYWLCKKKNIYKFIFKYHRTVKNPVQFSYGRELIKIVRRIIKCHPSQGQQFGTPHLLVTYNHTSWTRQDKMFAILKFQQQTNAATFSHAFVLTIKIFPSSEHSLFSLKYPIIKEADAGTTFKDLNVSLDTEEKISKTMIYTTDKVSPKYTAIYQDKEDQISKYSEIEDTFNKTSETKVFNFQDNIVKNSENFNESLNTTKNATTTAEVDCINTEFQNNINENKSTNCNIQRCERNVDQYSIDHIKEQSLRTTKMDKISIEKVDDRYEETKSIAIQKSNQDIQNVQKCKIFSSLKSEMIRDDVNKWTLSNGFGFYDNSMERNICPLNNKETSDDSRKTISETIVNSDNVLDQYFIETEIQHNKIKNITTINTDNNLSANNKFYKSRKQKNRESEKKTISDDKVLRSSNITDLVMEGLMFTIRQDQDSVAVIEQKTKLEVDEVLENSEKVETKAGEKCLLNSSLLRLENLVTMIDSPREDKDQQQKTTCHAVFQHILFSSEKKNTRLQSRDLLTNNTDVEETNNREISVKRFYNSPLPSNPTKMFTKKESSIISKESGLTKLPQQEANGLRIVSDKAITIEQMPVALQKVLQHRTRGLSSTSKSNMLQSKEKTQYTTLTETSETATSETAISFMDNNIKSDITNNSSVEFTVDSEKIKNCNNKFYVTMNEEINEDTYARNTKEKNNESNRTSQRSSSLKNNSPRKLQDITEDFYYDLLHARNKDNAIRQRCLRQKQRSLTNPDNIKNGKVRIEMLKFIQDITEGVRVVVRRLNIDNKSNLLEKSSTLTTCMN
ncbi:uncharacterized protein [Anoplolepis gracilipes]|uniref:uncharacterized protein n=1 Tax=Anoplolepis gracilipes TaxID=354296 RepID=UPI003B9E68C0